MDEPVDLGKAHLRVARPTDQLAAVVAFYLPDETQRRAAVARWRGRTFEDPDGYRIVPQTASWST